LSIRISQLTKRYGQQTAVDAISFEVSSGNVVGFLGPNGAGKSTTMRILSGYMPPDSGKAEVAGYDVVKESMEVRRRIGYLPENTPLYTDMYVKEFLSFIANTYQLNNVKQCVADTIERVGLAPEQHKKIGMLSKGYRQRVGLAQAIIHDPQVLILDEPTSGLDPNQLAEIRALIKTLGKDKTVLLSTHIMQEVEALCNNVVIINRGRIVANDAIDDLKLKYNEKNLELIFRNITS
jgi:ABC-2 type transport system ATP-binding protein